MLDDPFYYEEFEYKCMDCDEHEERLGGCKELLVDIMAHLFGSGVLNVDSLENKLEELCDLLYIRYPADDIRIQRK